MFRRAVRSGKVRVDASPVDLAVLLIANAGLIHRTVDDAPRSSSRLVALWLAGVISHANVEAPPAPTVSEIRRALNNCGAAQPRTAGGVLQARLAPTDDVERQKAIDAGHDLDRILLTEDLVSGENVFFTATGVTDGDLLRGVRFSGGGAHTQSIVMRSKSGTVRVIEAYHRIDKLREYASIDFTGDANAPAPMP